MRKSLPERWIFTDHEIGNPASCRRDDPFVAELDGLDLGVIVTRTGEVTDHWEDGAPGVHPEFKAEARKAETLRKPVYASGNYAQNEADEQATNWRSVLANSDGSFADYELPH